MPVSNMDRNVGAEAQPIWYLLLTDVHPDVEVILGRSAVVVIESTSSGMKFY